MRSSSSKPAKPGLAGATVLKGVLGYGAYRAHPHHQDPRPVGRPVDGGRDRRRRSQNRRVSADAFWPDRTSQLRWAGHAGKYPRHSLRAGTALGWPSPDAAQRHRDGLAADPAGFLRGQKGNHFSHFLRRYDPTRPDRSYALSAQTSAGVMPRSFASARAEFSAISVRTQPGKTALEVIPCAPPSCATERIRPNKPCLELL